MSFNLGKGIFCKGEKSEIRGKSNNEGDGVFLQGTDFGRKLVNEMTNFLLSMFVKTASTYPSATLTFFLHLHGCI